MRVALDALLLSSASSYRNAGVSRYLRALLAALAEHGGGLDITTFVSAASALGAPRVPPGGAVAGARLRYEAAPPRVAYPLARLAWQQTALPLRAQRLGVAVFAGPVQTLPLILPCPGVVTVHDLAFLRFPRFYRPARRAYQRWAVRQSVRAATRIVAVSQSTRRDLIALLGVPPDRVRVVPPAVDADFQPVRDTGTLAAFRAAYGLPERYLLYLGTLEPRKNVAGLLVAYARLRAGWEDAPPLVIAGARGWYADALEAQARRLGVARAVRFVGYVARTEQPLWYAAASAFVYPSWYEGFGLPVVEALACGTPVVTSSGSSLPEAGGSLATYVAPGDEERLAQALRETIREDAQHLRAQREGPCWARSFSAARLATTYAACLREAAGIGAGEDVSCSG